jgi:hypothetical protein
VVAWSTGAAVLANESLAPIVHPAQAAMPEPQGLAPFEDGDRLAPVVNAWTTSEPMTIAGGTSECSPDEIAVAQANGHLAPIVEPAEAAKGAPAGLAEVADDSHLPPILAPLADRQPRTKRVVDPAVGETLAPIVNPTRRPDRAPGIIARTGLVSSILGAAPTEAMRIASSRAEIDAGYEADGSAFDLWTDNGRSCTTSGSWFPTACGAGDCGIGLEGCVPRCFQGTFVVFGEFTHMRPRDAEIAYGVPVDGLIGNPAEASLIQVGRVGVVDPDHQPGFRVGAGVALDECRAVIARYWQLESNTSDQIAVANDEQVIRSLVSHPSSDSSAIGFAEAQAHYDIDFDLVDVESQHLWRCGYDHAISYSVGARYAKLQQDFRANFANGEAEQVMTDIGFDGGGIRLGLDAHRFALGRCFYLYGRAAASFLAGQFRASYYQGQAFDPEVVNTRWEAGRVVTILDLETGLGWESPGGGLRWTAGYAFSGWLNAVGTDNLISATQTNDFGDMDDTLSFDGLTTGLELRF